ncbi:hypothetical protein [Massilia genomosp. 1]|uniref:Uncharacterized protein n=1 Tax=Massilia genomosp. 1 TaxID=2609280 RepID=A0ABX0MTK7_9BURK|nr:hypothetical protein [Massilia genomosp. 1]NHZ63363.1 hypothetical protein [Massilia genomosp. 1]
MAITTYRQVHYTDVASSRVTAGDPHEIIQWAFVADTNAHLKRAKPKALDRTEKKELKHLPAIRCERALKSAQIWALHAVFVKFPAVPGTG